MTVLDLIGNTDLWPLGAIVPPGSARILLKLEYQNPTGSMKDRMARAMVEAALADGRLAPGGAVVEFTGGSTGVGLALVCAAHRLPLHLVTSDAFSLEKRRHMAALGAELTVIHSPTGGTTRALTEEMVATADRIARERGAYWTDQFNNRDVLPAYARMADEILAQAGGRIDAFVQMVGTAGSIRGNAERFKQVDSSIRIVALEPAESPVLSGGAPGSHGIEGAGPGFVMPLWPGTPVDEVRPVSTADAVGMARRLAREEGIFAGVSTGANVLAALDVAFELGPDATVVTVAIDSGIKYLSGAVFLSE